MKNVIYFLIVAMGLCNLSFAGECINGVCAAAVRPVRKIVNITREVVVPRRTVNNSCCNDCVGDSCSCKTTTQYQPLRRRVVTRSNVVIGTKLPTSIE